MKKFMHILFAALLVIVLAACGDDETSGETDNTENDAPQTEENKQDDGEVEDKSDTADKDKEEKPAADNAKAKDVFDKATEANKDLNSFHVVMDMVQNMESDDGESFDSVSTIKMDIVQEPLSMKQVMTMDLGELGKQEMELYFTEEGFYMFDPEQDQWLKLPSETSDEILGAANAQTDLDGQLDQFEDFADEFELEETDNAYILHLAADSEKFNELFKSTLEDALPEGLDELGGDPFDGVTFEEVIYDISVNKDSYIIEGMNIQMTLQMDMEGEKITLDQDVKSKYSEHNKIDEIVIPEEVLEHAVEVEF